MGFYRIIEQQRVKSEKVNFGPQKGGVNLSQDLRLVANYILQELRDREGSTSHIRRTG